MYIVRRTKHFHRWQPPWLTMAFLLFAALSTPDAIAQRAPDASAPGPMSTTTVDYWFPAMRDPIIWPCSDPTDMEHCLMTQIKARVYRPLSHLAPNTPLLIFLHGNHATCGRDYDPRRDPPAFAGNPRIDDNVDFTKTGICPDGYNEVPSYLGYAYLAQRLASWGYVVVSIDANRGINGGPVVVGDEDLIFTRARLVLTHLERLSRWNAMGGAPAGLEDIFGNLDFGNVGLLGHSRGGEAMRAVYNVYHADGSPWPGLIPNHITFKGIFEIGPTDSTEPGLNADGTAWNVLLPMCDSDVSDLGGVRPFDRMMRSFALDTPATPKSTYTVWGANHNFYNTEWQISDQCVKDGATWTCIAMPCTGQDNNALFPLSPGSSEQRLTALSSVLAFFRANIGATIPTFNRNFNTFFDLPLNVNDESLPPMAIIYPTRVDRGYTPSSHPNFTLVFEDFEQVTGTNTYGIQNESRNIMIMHNNVTIHDPIQRAGLISWNAAGANVYFQTNWTAVNAPGLDISAYKTLDLRVARQDAALNLMNETDFSIRLVGANGIMTRPLRLSLLPALVGPVGNDSGPNPTMQTKRIRLTDFGNYDFVKRQVRGVRLIFDQAASGAIYVANIRLSTTLEPGVNPSGPSPSSVEILGLPPIFSPRVNPAFAVSERQMVSEGRINSIRKVAKSGQLGGQPGVEIEIFSEAGFPVRDQIVVLRMGEHEYTISRYASGDLHTLIFTLSDKEFAKAGDGEEMIVKYGRGASRSIKKWNLGRLKKSMMNR
jgi:hypothetical protein